MFFLSRSAQRGSSVASGNCSRQASSRRKKQRCAVWNLPQVWPLRSPVRMTLLLLPLATTEPPTLHRSTTAATRSTANTTATIAPTTPTTAAATTPCAATDPPTTRGRLRERGR
ncbi:unnamed protein product [Closterium sp. NIES-53]